MRRKTFLIATVAAFLVYQAAIYLLILQINEESATIDKFPVGNKSFLVLNNGSELIRLGPLQEDFKFERINIKDAYLEIFLKNGVVFVYYNGTTQFEPNNIPVRVDGD